jgi:hypothetical protein
MSRKMAVRQLCGDDRKRRPSATTGIGRMADGSHVGLGHFGRLQVEGAGDRREAVSGAG